MSTTDAYLARVRVQNHLDACRARLDNTLAEFENAFLREAAADQAYQEAIKEENSRRVTGTTTATYTYGSISSTATQFNYVVPGAM